MLPQVTSSPVTDNTANHALPRSTNPLVFVTGCARSGTTLLQRILNNHPQLAVSNDTHVVPRSLLHRQLAAGPQLTEELVEEVTGYKYFCHLGIDEQAVREIAGSSTTFIEFARGLYDAFARYQGKPLAGEKDPEYVRALPLLHRLFPATRILHIIRDGRDVTLSALEWVTPSRFLGRLPLWREEPVAVCALWWRRQVSAGRLGSEAVGAESCLEVRYEELAQSPEATARSIVDFLGLSYAPEMLDYHRGKTRLDPRLPSKKQWLPPTSGLRDWRSQLSLRDLQLFEALAGELLSSLGYPLATGGTAPRSVTAAAERCRRWWAAEVEDE